MEFHRSYLLALIQGLFYPLTLILLYLVATYNGKVYPVLPYISDTGAYKPEGCFFSQILATASVLTTACMYIRYGLVSYICRVHKQDEAISKWNTRALVAGLTMTICECIAGNFGVMDIQEIHLIAATTGITAGISYVCIQAWVSSALYPIIGEWKMNSIRWIMTVVIVVSYLLLLIFAGLSVLYYEDNLSEFDFTKWGPKDGGYEYHVVSALSEWIVVLSISTFISTFMLEFRHIVVMEPEFKIKCIKGETEKQKQEQKTSINN